MSASNFQLPFVGRSRELCALTTFYERGGYHQAGFLLLYGRRGIGKTRLLHQFIEEQAIAEYFYWQAPSGDEATQLRAFTRTLWQYGAGQNRLPPDDFAFFDWREALDYIAQIAELSDGEKLFIIEGFTDLCQQSPSLSSCFQHAWDHRLKEVTNLRLIVTGSHIGTMVREVFAYSAPLYFRANGALHLQGLPYTALLELFPECTAEERLCMHTITGGNPSYLTYFPRAIDLAAAVEQLCFASDSSFLTDMETLFDESLENLAFSHNILERLADEYLTFEQLSQQFHDDLEKHLFDLELLKLIKRTNSVHKPITSLMAHYQLIEPSLDFYYTHLKTDLNKNSRSEAAKAAITSLNNSLGKTAFITLCREWVWAASMTKAVELLPQRVGGYWDEQMHDQIFPIAAFDPQKKILLLGLPLWENDSLEANQLDELIQKTRLTLKDQPDVSQIELVVFGRWPFTAEVKSVANSAGVRLVTLADIELQLVMAEEARKIEQNSPMDESFEF